jgi:mono/diheme cytochrome c family protein
VKGVRPCASGARVLWNRTMGRTTIKLAAFVIFAALACGGWAISSRAAQRNKAAAVVRGGAVDAHAVYSRHCASCHGEDGDAKTEKGELYGATDFTDKKWWGKQRPTDARLRRAITAGKRGGMPAFGKRISAAEINALVSYVKDFKGK